jgi:hypothetical protein
MYAELYKYDGTTFTLIATSPHEILYDGTALNLYTFAMTVPSTTLAITDRLAVKLYATNSGGKTTTVHTQDSHLCQIITTFSTGITALNGLTAQVQYFATGTSGTDFNISSTTATHTFNIPDASATNRGLITTGTQTIAGNKTFSSAVTASFFVSNSGILLSTLGQASSGGNYGAINAGTDYIDFRPAGGGIFFLKFPYSTFRTFTLPDASGTLALTSDIPSLANYVTLNGIQTITGGKTFTSDLSVAKIAIANSNTLYTTTGYTTLSASNVGSTSWLGLVWGNGGGNAAVLAFNNTAQFTYTFPATNGTIALLSGTQTFTGATTFSSSVTANSSTTGTQVMANFAAANYGSPSSRTYIQIGTQYGDGSSRIGSINTTGNQSALIFQTQSASSGVFNDAMYINGTGNVGIGTSSPGNYKLYVANGTSSNKAVKIDIGYGTGSADFGGLEISRSNTNLVGDGSSLIFSALNSSNAEVEYGAYGCTIESNSAGNQSGRLQFMTSSNGITRIPRMTITSGGELQVAYSGGAGFIRSQATYTNTSANVPNMYVGSAYEFGRGTASSMRYKENINDWNESGINTILALKPKTFTYKEEYYKNPERVILGLIAEEVAETCKYLADYENEDGSGEVENVRYAYIVVPLIKAIQEQQIQIQNLQEQNQDLKSRLDKAGL